MPTAISRRRPKPPLNGVNLTVSTKGGVKLNGEANVTKTDVAAPNGLIHVIDAVLMPK